MSTPEQYACDLGSLVGQAFQDEVSARLAAVYLDFQTVPPKPHGDAGLDGYSHNQTIAYFCYGPEQVPLKTSTDSLKNEIIKKFSEDMRSLFELDHDERKLVHATNHELRTIVARGCKFKHIQLVVSYFETHRVLGPLRKAFNKYRAKSKCIYVEPSVTMCLWGPKEVAAKGPIDEHTAFRAERRRELLGLKVALANGTLPEPPSSDFDTKFDWIESQSKRDLSRTRERYRKAWSVVLGLEETLANTSSEIHRDLEEIRDSAASDAEMKSTMDSEPARLILDMQSILNEKIRARFANSLPPEVIDAIIQGDIGRMIGECPLGWSSR